MSITEHDIEQAIQDKGLTAPRITPDAIDQLITDEMYHSFENTTVIVCLLVLRNGYCVVGSSACASPDNYDVAIGQKIARADARDKIWALEGYALRERLSSNSRGRVQR